MSIPRIPPYAISCIIKGLFGLCTHWHLCRIPCEECHKELFG